MVYLKVRAARRHPQRLVLKSAMLSRRCLHPIAMRASVRLYFSASAVPYHRRRCRPSREFGAARRQRCRPPGFGNSLKTRCDVDAIAKDIVVVDNDVTDMYSDAKLDPEFPSDIGILFGNVALDLCGASSRIYGTCKFHQHAITGRLDDAASMRCDSRVDKCFSDRFQPGQSAFLVHSHQAAITSDVRRQYRC